MTDVDLGPIDLVVIGYPAGSPISGEAAPLLVDLVERGVIHVLDATFVVKESDGSYTGASVEDMDGAVVGDFAVFRGAGSGIVGDDDVALIAEAMEPGEAALVILYENRWAAPFAAAVRRNGGRLLATERIAVQDLLDAIDAVGA